MKDKIMDMYKDAARRLDVACSAAEGKEQGSEERDLFERVYGERQAYSRILKELYGIEPSELQAVLDHIYKQDKSRGL